MTSTATQPFDLVISRYEEYEEHIGFLVAPYLVGGKRNLDLPLSPQIGLTVDQTRAGLAHVSAILALMACALTAQRPEIDSDHACYSDQCDIHFAGNDEYGDPPLLEITVPIESADEWQQRIAVSLRKSSDTMQGKGFNV